MINTISKIGYIVADYGTELDNGSFTGFAGILQRGEVDIVATDLTVTLQVLKLLRQAGGRQGTKKMSQSARNRPFYQIGDEIGHFLFLNVAKLFCSLGATLETG